jgi:hypothetical protein
VYQSRSTSGVVIDDDISARAARGAIVGLIADRVVACSLFHHIDPTGFDRP